MPRQGRLDAPGVLHHVMTRGTEKGAIFRDAADYTGFVGRLARILPESRAKCYAWALMPNHVHLVLVTGVVPLSVVLQRLFTGHATAFNQRWGRSGHLYQNRYKSLLCDADAHLKELVRYVHLNPVRAGLCRGLGGLARYKWTGHRTIMGLAEAPWQDAGTVLSEFGESMSRARKVYLEFLAEGLKEPVEAGLQGQGLRRLIEGGWEEDAEKDVKAAKGRSDERIVGDPSFVEKVLRESEQRERVRSRLKRAGMTIAEVVRQAAKAAGIEAAEVSGSGKRPAQVRARALACYWVVEKLGMKEVEVARRLGITQPAVSQAIRRGRMIVTEEKLNLREP